MPNEHITGSVTEIQLLALSVRRLSSLGSIPLPLSLMSKFQSFRRFGLPHSPSCVFTVFKSASHGLHRYLSEWQRRWQRHHSRHITLQTRSSFMHLKRRNFNVQWQVRQSLPFLSFEPSPPPTRKFHHSQSKTTVSRSTRTYTSYDRPISSKHVQVVYYLPLIFFCSFIAIVGSSSYFNPSSRILLIFLHSRFSTQLLKIFIALPPLN
jgi:hypothetical protein